MTRLSSFILWALSRLAFVVSAISSATLAITFAQPSFASESQFSITTWQQRYEAEAFIDYSLLEADATFKIASTPGYNIAYSYNREKPYWPTLGASYTHADTEGLGFVVIKFLGIPISESTLIGELDLSHLDLTAHYEWALPWLSLNGGIIIRRFDAGVFLGTLNGRDANLPITDTIPIPQIGVSHEWAMRQHHLGFAANYATIRFNLDEIIDVDANIYWRFPKNISAAIGYRDMDIDYSISTGLVEARTRGATFSLAYHW